MEHIKTAEDSIRQKMHIHFLSGKYRVDCQWPVSEMVHFLEEYAAQFQPKWIEGVPDDYVHCYILIDNGKIKNGFHGKNNGWHYQNDVGEYFILKRSVLAYCPINIAPPIPDHLKAKIK